MKMYAWMTIVPVGHHGLIVLVQREFETESLIIFYCLFADGNFLKHTEMHTHAEVLLFLFHEYYEKHFLGKTNKINYVEKFNLRLCIEHNRIG